MLNLIKRIAEIMMGKVVSCRLFSYQLKLTNYGLSTPPSHRSLLTAES